MFVKWFPIETSTGVKKVQGLGEKFVAESLIDLVLNGKDQKR